MPDQHSLINTTSCRDDQSLDNKPEPMHCVHHQDQMNGI